MGSRYSLMGPPGQPCAGALSLDFARLFAGGSRQPSQAQRTQCNRGSNCGANLEDAFVFFAPRGIVYDLGFMGVLAHRLRLEGHPVHFLLCDNLPACSQRDAQNPAPQMCRGCVDRNADFLDFNNFGYSSIWDHTTDEDLADAQRIAAAITPNNLSSLVDDDVPVGRLQEIAVARYLFRSGPDDSEQSHAVCRTFALSGVLLARALRRLLSNGPKPRAFLATNGKTSWTSMLGVVAKQAEVDVISFENFAPLAGCGEGKSWCFSREGAAVNFDLGAAWEKWRAVPLTGPENDALNTYLSSRLRGTRFHPDPAEDAERLRQQLRLPPQGERPVVTLCANVPWDTSVLQKNTIFADPFDWIAKSVQAVRGAPVTLVVRVHPAEKGVDGFVTRQTVSDEVARRVGPLPDNVRLIPADDPASTYTLRTLSDLMVVYTSTVGLEAVLAGRRALVCSSPHYSGRGFTREAQSVSQYALWLREPWRVPAVSPEEREQARRYAYLFFFRQLIPLHFCGVRALWEVSHFRVRDAAEVAPGANPYLDLVVRGLTQARRLADNEAGPSATDPGHRAHPAPEDEPDFVLPRHLNHFGTLRWRGPQASQGSAAYLDGLMDSAETRAAQAARLCEQGDVAGAARVYKVGLARQPQAPQLVLGYAELLLDHGYVDEALGLMAPMHAQRRGLEDAAIAASLWNTWLDACCVRGDRGRLLLAVQQCLGEQANVGSLVMRCAVLLLSQGMLQEAAKVMHHAATNLGEPAAARWIERLRARQLDAGAAGGRATG